MGPSVSNCPAACTGPPSSLTHMYDHTAKHAHAITLTTHSTEANQANSVLPRLPPKLRNRVYRYAFHGYLKVYQKEHITQDLRRSSKALIGTCLQIRSEITPLLYSASTFYFKRVPHKKFADNVGKEKRGLIWSICVPASILHALTPKYISGTFAHRLKVFPYLQELRVRGTLVPSVPLYC
ncbi:hypothetical protein HBH56_212850 [Parastagonospora nodorum]|nr:hypothetical protein HBH56_212850 [Parastagonospora nodorum]KAH3923160.1 hypothetical protein HBH54_214520 [Parastagonospora nodorum]KAH4128547.1 hypothetical protein HBH45_209970 [Parastagonospora nodorum]KAH4149104.1 hypothetical protein HBH44_199070 [Parastagonospora nodorum]KAH4159196.1 hypothetical protein HBH43_188410 [Parastagonospora nodorum]